MLESRTVYVVDDDEAIRRSAAFMLRTSGYVVETYESGLKFLTDAKSLAAGCILLDVGMPEMDGLEVQRALREKGVLMPVIVLTGSGDVSIAVAAMKGGAIEFIEKPFEKSTLLAAIEEGLARLENAGRRHARADEAKDRLKACTARELDVLGGLVRGHPNKTMAYDFGISPRTVEIHRATMMTKLGVSNLSDALRLAFAAGLGDTDGDSESV